MAHMRPCLMIALLCFALLASQALCEEAKTEEVIKTTFPEPPSQITPSGSIVRELDDVLMQVLDNTSAPWVTALIAVGFGGIMMCRGPRWFKWIVQAVVGFFFFLLSTDILTEHLSRDISRPDIYILAAATGVIFAYAANKGYDGVLVLIGFLVGALFYYGILRVLSHWISPSLVDNRIVFLLFGALPIGVSVYVCAKEKHMIMKPVALLTSFVGSCLVASGLVFCVMLLNGQGHKCPAFGDYLAMLTHPSSEPVCTDVHTRLASYALGVFLFLVSAVFQIQRVGKYEFLSEIFQKKDLDLDGNISKLEMLGAIINEKNVRDHFGLANFSDEAVKLKFEKCAGNTDGTFTLDELFKFYDDMEVYLMFGAKILGDTKDTAGTQAREPLLPPV